MRKNISGQKFHFSLFKNGARIAVPTMTASDFRIDIDNLGQNPVTTTPTSDAAGLVTWLPSQNETNGTYITFLANDAAGMEWEPLTAEFLTTPETSIESILDDTGTSGVASVTGNVGGNVTGSVGSVAGNVTGSVGSVAGGVTGSIGGDVAGKVLGGGVSVLAGTGARVVDAAGNNVGTAAAQTTILDRLGAWTGAGLNTVLGALRALAAKGAGLTPTDISGGTTFDNTADSNEAIRDAAFTGGAVAGVTGNVSGNVVGSVGSVAVGGITATSIATDAIDADALATSATDEITDSVWAEALPGVYLVGSAGYILGNLIASITASVTFLIAIAQAVWAWVPRTLTQYAVAVMSSDMAQTNLTAHRGDTWSFGITGLGDIALRTKLWFAVKESADDTDAMAQLFITEAGGLTVVNGAAYATIAHGSITVTNAVQGNVTIFVHEAATAMLAANHARFWDMQVKLPSGVYTRGYGDVDMTRDITRGTV